jgi:hypothetical protein
MRRSFGLTVGTLAGFLLLASTMGAAAATASPAPWRVFVSPSGAACGHPGFSSINAAVAAVHAGGTVVVCRGTYNEDVVVSKPLNLVGHNATVDPSHPVLRKNSPLFSAAGNNAFTLMAPHVTVGGFRVVHATGDGIFAAANRERIVGNWAFFNGATGISLNGSSFSLVKANVAAHNAAGGITLANDVGSFVPGATASHDRVVGNLVRGNPFGCGVVLADHLGTTVSGARGIFDNLIAWNVIRNNGNGGSNQPDGGGVLLASEAPGAAVWGNRVVHNRISGSGLGGITVHSHAGGQNFTGNVFGWNVIGTNNVGGDFADPHTTGIFVGSVDALSIAIVGNRIHNNHTGIFKAGPVSIRGRFSNVFGNVQFDVRGTPAYAG